MHRKRIPSDQTRQTAATVTTDFSDDLEPRAAGNDDKRGRRAYRTTTVWERAAVAFHIFLLYFSGFLIYPLLVYLAWSRWPLLWFLMLEYLLYTCGPGKRAARGAQNGWPKLLRRWPLYKTVANYFPIRLHRTAEPPPHGKPYICCLHPHGIFAFSGFIGFATNGAGFDDQYPDNVFHCLTLVLSFRTPLVREYHLMHGNRDVSRETFKRVLGAGETVGVVPGGGTESLLSTPGTNRIILRRRKGFVKQALLTGAALVPGYAFGETSLYRTSNELPEKSLLRRFQRWMTRTFGFTIPLFHGCGVLLPWGIVPYPVPIHVITGAPIDVPKFEGDTDGAEFAALVDKYHGLYTGALERLFADHKEKFAKEEGDLEIVE